MDGHIQKRVAKGLLGQRINQNKPYWNILVIVLVVIVMILLILFVNFKFTGDVVKEFDYGKLESTTAYDFWTLGNSSGTLQVDYVFVEPEQKYVNSTYYCFNGSVSNDVSSLFYLWYINGSLKPNLNTSSIVSGFPSASRNFSTYDHIDCGIIPQDSSLLAYWSFDEGSGVAFKEIINNNTGSSTVADWKVGRNHYSVNISEDNYYDVISPSGLNLTNNFTYEIWFKQDQIGTAVILDNADTVFIKLESGKAKGYLEISEEIPTLKIISNENIPLNQWNQLVMTYDNQNISLYLNGDLQNKTNLTGNVDDFSGNIAFGRLTATPTQYLYGQIDEVAIYNQSLSASEVLDHYNRGIIILSKHNTLILDVNEANFSVGTLTNVTYSSSRGGLILSNCSTNVYCENGEYISSIKTINDNEYEVEVFYGMESITNGNISFQVRTGINSDNGSIKWSNYSGIDPAYSLDNYKILALPFSEGKGTTVLDLVTGNSYNISNSDFTPEGYSGTALRFFGDGSLSIDDYAPLRLVNQNYSIELFIKPHISEEMIIFTKLKYYMYLNDSLNVIFNTSNDDGNLYTLSSNSSLMLNQWNHVVVTHDDENITKIYLNGTLSASQEFNSSITLDTTDLVLGYFGNLNRYNGSIDSFTIYNRTLSTDEVINRKNSLNPQGGYYDANDYVQYKAIFSTEDTASTPVITNVSMRLQNHSVFVYNSAPNNLSLTTPANNTIIGADSSSFLFVWNPGNLLEDTFILSSEWILSNYSNFSEIVDSNLGVNNYSIQDYTDPQTLIVEHFDYKEDLYNHGWDGNLSATSGLGRYNNGLLFEQRGNYLRTNSRIIDSKEGSIEFWIKPNWNANDSQTNYFFYHNTNGLSLNRTGSQLLYSVGTTNVNKITYNISNWEANVWYHVATSWKRNGNISLIIDGIEVNTTTIGFINSFYGERFYLGSNADITNSNIIINGTIDELRISNVFRKEHSALLEQELNVSIINISDGTYYWKVNRIEFGNFSLDNEIINGSSDIRQINLKRKFPLISFTVDYSKDYSETTTTINFSSSENLFCQYRTYNSDWIEINYTSGSIHSQIFNLTNFGNFTYYFNCNDSSNNFVNKTYSYYIFNRSVLAYINVTERNLTAGTRNVINFSASEIHIGYLEITTRDYMTSKLGMIKHIWNQNPENSSTGLEPQIIAFWTIFLDDNLVTNLTGNVTTRLIYNALDISGVTAVNLSLYWFNPKTSIWEYQGENVLTNDQVVIINTSRFGTYALSGTGVGTSTTPTNRADTGAALKPKLLKTIPTEYIECRTDSDCFEGYICEYNFCVEEIIYDEIIIEEEPIYIDEEAQTNLFQDIEDFADSILKSAGLFEGNKLLLTLVYVLILGMIVFYGYRMGLALLFKFQKKNLMKIEDLEKNIDDKIKYYAYNHINRNNLKEELLKKGFSENRVNNLLSNVNKLGKGKFEDYIFKSLAKGDNEQEILKRLIDKGWEEIKINKEIENFKRI